MSLVNNFTVKKVRSSNLELLRLLSMFFVLVVHTDFQALGMPGQDRNDNSSFIFCISNYYRSICYRLCQLFRLIIRLVWHKLPH